MWGQRWGGGGETHMSRCWTTSFPFCPFPGPGTGRAVSAGSVLLLAKSMSIGCILSWQRKRLSVQQIVKALIASTVSTTRTQFRHGGPSTGQSIRMRSMKRASGSTTNLGQAHGKAISKAQAADGNQAKTVQTSPQSDAAQHHSWGISRGDGRAT